jgi:hypothetical protein
MFALAPETVVWHATIQAEKSRNKVGVEEKKWFRDLDSNQDFRLQRPTCYQLHHPGVDLQPY